MKRFASIWFCQLTTDWFILRRPELKNLAFVVKGSERGRMVVNALSTMAHKNGIRVAMSLADAKALVPDLEVLDDKPDLEARLLKALGTWFIRYAPIIAVNAPDGLVLDVSGCTHLWGGETAYLNDIISRLANKGYRVQGAIADTVGTAWAMARFAAPGSAIVKSGEQAKALSLLPVAALRLDTLILQRLHKLGFYQISSFIRMPRTVLRRRFGETLIKRLEQAIGLEQEFILPLEVPATYQERLPSLDPIRTVEGIEIAIKKLLEILCLRLQKEGKGIRTAVLTCYRIDGKIEKVQIGTNTASAHVDHLFELFELKIARIEPALGIDLFIMEALEVEDVSSLQEVLWTQNSGMDEQDFSELLDRLAVKLGPDVIHRYLPDAHYWPERAIRLATTLSEKPTISWPTHQPRPTQLLKRPEQIEVAAPIPDYPPMLFRYKGQVHHIKKADGPERIEREWWMDPGEHRDYYQVEDENGRRYWLFRSGHYADDQRQNWFIHGYFA